MNQKIKNIGSQSSFSQKKKSGKPTVLPVKVENIPVVLRAIPRWVMWRLVQRTKPNGDKVWAKLPMTVDGHAAKSTAPATWTTFDDACDALIMGDFDGIGLVLGADVQGIDLDDCRSPDGTLSDLANEVLARVDGYAEVSPSGTGIKVFALTNLDRSRTKKEVGVELYRDGRYFTVTGHDLSGSSLSTVNDLGWLVQQVWGEHLGPADMTGDVAEMALANYKPPIEDWDIDRVTKDILPNLDPNGGYQEWLEVGAILHHQGEGDSEWLDLWDNWSSASGKWIEGECAEKWRSFKTQRTNGHGPKTLATLILKAKERRQATTYKSPDGTHVLARFVEIDGELKQPTWVIPGFIGVGVVVIAGAHGAGKTTAILPLAMIAAGLIPSALAPLHWRHVIYVTEDVEQAKRIITGIVKYGGLGISLELVKERLHIVEAVRLNPAAVAEVGDTYKDQFVREIDGAKVLPLLVLDTKSAVLALENENDNAEASAMMAAMKQAFGGITVWLIGHAAKEGLNRRDVKSSRGASAVDADANQTVFLIVESGKRYLVQGKTRFEPRWPELEITSFTHEAIAPDEFGNLEPLTLRWGIAAPPIQSRKDASKNAAEVTRIEKEACLRQEIISKVEEGWDEGTPLNKTNVTKQIKRKKSEVVAVLDGLLTEGKLHEVEVPSQFRINNSKSRFLVSLTETEREAYLLDGTVPSNKKAVPASWRKHHD
jgi:hypothetical protein